MKSVTREKPMECRGEDTRCKIVQEYELHPIAHVQLLEGQSKKSCTGDTLTNAYYCFSYKARIISGDKDKDEGTLLCGEHAAEHFLQLINHAKLPLFNPLRTQGNGGGTGTGGTSQGPKIKWDDTAKQLHDAINLLIVCWSVPPRFALGDIKRNLEKFSTSTPFPSKVKAVNTIIGYDSKKRTLAQMVSELAQSNSLKTYDFKLLDAILAHEGISSNFT